MTISQSSYGTRGLFIATERKQFPKKDWYASAISKFKIFEYEFKDIFIVYDTLARHLRNETWKRSQT